MNLSPNLSPLNEIVNSLFKPDTYSRFLGFLYYTRENICVSMSPNKDKVIDIIIEKACFCSGDKSGDTFWGVRLCA